MPGTIGYTSIGATNGGAADSTWAAEANIGSAQRYTAVSGDTVTQFAYYGHASGSPVNIQMGVYTWTGTHPGTLVGSAVTVSVGTTLGWHTASASIALSAGTTYVVATTYWNGTTGVASVYFDSPAGTNNDGATVQAALPATWTSGYTGAEVVSKYATVTGAGSSAATDAAAFALTAPGRLSPGGRFNSLFDDLAAGPAAIPDENHATTGLLSAGAVLRYAANTFTARYPVSISGRKILADDGLPFLSRVVASWRMALRLTNAEITTAIDGIADTNAGNGVLVWVGGGEDRGDATTPRYTDIDGNNFWTGTAWQSTLGPAWSKVDRIVAECARRGLIAHLSFCGGWNNTGPGTDWETASNAQMYAVGQAVATRYLNDKNIVWHLMLDSSHLTSSTRGQRAKQLFDGINDTEGATTRPFRWMEVDAGVKTSGQGWTGDVDVNPIECIYDSSGSSVDVIEAAYAATSLPTGDCEPPYVASPNFSTGTPAQQQRERTFAVFLEGGQHKNWGDEEFWPFGALKLFSRSPTPLTWQQVLAEATTLEQGYIGTVLDTYLRDVAWAPTSSFVTTGAGTGDTKAAIGASNNAAIAYFPDSRTVTVDTTILAGTGNVRLRWFDPVANAYSTVAASEAQNAARSVTYPTISRSDSTTDAALVVDLIDHQVTGAVYSGGAPYAVATHTATPTAPLYTGAAPAATATKLGTITGLLEAAGVAFGVVTSQADVSTSGLLAAGTSLQATVTKLATASAMLPSGSAPIADVTHAATVAALLEAGGEPVAVATKLATAGGLLSAGGVPYAVVTSASDIATTGLALAGAAITAAVSRTASVAGLLAASGQSYAPVTRTAATVGFLTGAGVPVAVVGALTNISTTGLALAGGGITAGGVSHDATIAAQLTAGATAHSLVTKGWPVVATLASGATMHAPASKVAAITALLEAGGQTFAVVTRTASTTGLLTAGALVGGGQQFPIVIVGPAVLVRLDDNRTIVRLDSDRTWENLL